jgi:hypothetical protein
MPVRPLWERPPGRECQGGSRQECRSYGNPIRFQPKIDSISVYFIFKPLFSMVVFARTEVVWKQFLTLQGRRSSALLPKQVSMCGSCQA